MRHISRSVVLIFWAYLSLTTVGMIDVQRHQANISLLLCVGRDWSALQLPVGSAAAMASGMSTELDALELDSIAELLYIQRSCLLADFRWRT